MLSVFHVLPKTHMWEHLFFPLEYTHRTHISRPSYTPTTICFGLYKPTMLPVPDEDLSILPGEHLEGLKGTAAVGKKERGEEKSYRRAGAPDGRICAANGVRRDPM